MALVCYNSYEVDFGINYSLICLEHLLGAGGLVAFEALLLGTETWVGQEHWSRFFL